MARRQSEKKVAGGQRVTSEDSLEGLGWAKDWMTAWRKAQGAALPERVRFRGSECDGTACCRSLVAPRVVFDIIFT